MEPSTQRSWQSLQLTLLLIFFLCGSSASPVTLAEVQPQQLVPGSEFAPDTFEDDESSNDFVNELLTKEFLSLSLSCVAALSLAGSDAYPSITLHGPPVAGNIAQAVAVI